MLDIPPTKREKCVLNKLYLWKIPTWFSSVRLLKFHEAQLNFGVQFAQNEDCAYRESSKIHCNYNLLSHTYGQINIVLRSTWEILRQSFNMLQMWWLKNFYICVYLFLYFQLTYCTVYHIGTGVTWQLEICAFLLYFWLMWKQIFNSDGRRWFHTSSLFKLFWLHVISSFHPATPVCYFPRLESFFHVHAHL